MCGRGARDPNNRDLTLEERDLILEDDYRLYGSYNIAPTQDVPILVTVGKVEMAKWWLIPSYSAEYKVGQYSMFNKKSEELDKPYWAGLLKNKRCVIPFTGFIEWQKLDKTTKIPYYIYPCEDALFWMAGLYDDWVNKETGEVKRSFTILTMEPNGFIKEIHTRMPVFLDPKAGAVQKWLFPGFSDPKSLITTFPSDRMTKRRIGNDIGKAANNYPSLLDQVDDSPTTLF
ncbi:SOS response-associated peptidase [Chitinophaga agrisoli]|uniref:Abasic site processing protein n=1 Tax=Chitinophaga agrisoli TaxID=2607653 RepID=A0A5B2VW15_9BACT|nr:SOS response-associated peptidase [Chitinophaga agrisoli]KAA2242788.1 SOS response-associated peptidase [Chitinophaga agrisoli]